MKLKYLNNALNCPLLLFVNVWPAIGWQPVQGVPRLLSEDGWGSLQHAPILVAISGSSNGDEHYPRCQSYTAPRWPNCATVKFRLILFNAITVCLYTVQYYRVLFFLIIHNYNNKKLFYFWGKLERINVISMHFNGKRWFEIKYVFSFGCGQRMNYIRISRYHWMSLAKNEMPVNIFESFQSMRPISPGLIS